MGVIKCCRQAQTGDNLEENTGVKEEVATPSTEAEAPQAPRQEANLESNENANWKEAREVMRQQQSKIQELEGRINDNSKNSNEDFDEIDSLGADDIVTVGQARKLAEKIAQRTAREIASKNEAELRKIETYSKHSDFDAVVTPANIKKLEQEYPSLAEGISNSKNPYQGAYEAINSLYKKTQETSSEAAKKAEENLKKPQSVHSTGYQGALADASSFEKRILSAEQRSEIRKLSDKYAASR